MGSPARLPPFYRLAFFFLLLLFVTLEASHVDTSCLDAADSAYLISADAIAHGQVPYRDFLVAHPPLLFLVGALLAWMGAGVFPFRIFSIMLAALLGLVTLLLALKLSRNHKLAFLAGAFALFAPVGTFFSRLFLNDTLASLLATSMILLLYLGSKRDVVGASILAVLGILTKLTFLPLLALGIIFTFGYRRNHARLFLAVSLGGSLAAAIVLDFVTGATYLRDILSAQASKGYSFTNFYEGLGRIWQLDWPLLALAAPGIWIAIHRDASIIKDAAAQFLLRGWLIAGMVVLATLPAEGHDINIFLIAEPVLALLAAWGIMGLAEKKTATAVLAAVLLVVAVPAMISKDLSFLKRTNRTDVEHIVSEIKDRSRTGQPILAPGCFALQADRPVTLKFFDQFLWEEKYKRGDKDALLLIDQLYRNIEQGRLPAVVLSEDQETFNAVKTALAQKYIVAYSSQEWPPLTLWLLKQQPENDS